MRTLPPLKTVFLRVIKLIALGYCCLILLIYFYQENLLFHPTKLEDSYTFDLKNVREINVEVPGATLSALHFKLPDPKGIVFFLHGNGGSLQNWLTDTSFYEKANFDLFMLDYRGYGKSTGKISREEQLMNDVRIAWNQIAPQYQGKVKIIYGRSLGTALAAELSVAIKPELTVLVSPYYNMSEMAERYYPWVPGIALRYPLDTALYVRSINNPILIFHGGKDQLVPPEQSQRLVKENSLAELVIIPEAVHDDIHLFDGYHSRLMKTLENLSLSSGDNLN